MEEMHLLRAAHHDVPDPWNDKGCDILIDAVFDNRISVMTVYTGQEDHAHTIQYREIFDALLCGTVSHDMKFLIESIGFNQVCHPSAHIPYDKGFLCLEVTERCRLLDIDHLKNVTARLKSRGILVALDDFGTGFSSVGIVKELPFDIIKIDRGFIQKIEDSKTDRELIKYFSGLASLYGAKVCVEGIETEGMRDILQNFGVGSFQGYYYAKPLMLDQFFEWRDSFFDKRG